MKGSADLIRVTIVDYAGREIGKFRGNASDGKAIERIFAQIADKYGLKIFVKYYGDMPKEKLDYFIESLADFKW